MPSSPTDPSAPEPIGYRPSAAVMDALYRRLSRAVADVVAAESQTLPMLQRAVNLTRLVQALQVETASVEAARDAVLAQASAAPEHR